MIKEGKERKEDTGGEREKRMIKEMIEGKG